MGVRPGAAEPASAVLRRSALFVPAHVSRYVERAATAGADAVVLDLEDSVPADLKGVARSALDAAVGRLQAVADLVVRVNPGAELGADLRACAAAGVPEIVLPKVNGPADVHRLRERAGDYAPRLSVLVESARGLAALPEILACGPLVSVALGAEDLRAEVEWFAPGGPVSPVLLHANASVVLAAHAEAVVPLGLLGSIGAVRDLGGLRDGAARAWRMGYRGSYCVHPDQVEVLNQEYAPSGRDVAWARAAVEGADAARRAGRGAFLLDGAMVDTPLVDRAHRILGRAAAASDLERRGRRGSAGHDTDSTPRAGEPDRAEPPNRPDTVGRPAPRSRR